MHVVGADGDWTHATNVAAWVAEIEDYPAKSRPCTLFLVDACHAGDAARLPWLRAADSSTRAWVIAATEPDKLAYEGRFSQAAANVLDRIAIGAIDFYPSEYVPFGDIVEHIRREVARLGGGHQYVTSTPVDGRPAPPFFLNRRPPTDARLARVKQDADTAIEPFLDLDVALDAAHFLDRAAGHRFGAHLGAGCFTGRGQELTKLAAWLDGATRGSLRVVTGAAGSGKSALLGILVCAAHPRLRVATERLWSTAGETSLPRENPHLAAVHLRERDLPQTLAALIRQLDLPLPETETDPVTVIDAIAHHTDQQVIVVDALDEAISQDTILTRLLVPLARAVRADRTPACRLLVGMRPWEQFRPLHDLADAQDGLVDLDQIPPERLRGELQDYVNDLLSLVAYPLPSRRALKRNVAEALTASDRERGGEFLAAALYTNWLTGQYPAGVPPRQAADLARQVPRTVPDILNLELETYAHDRWLRPVLTAIAYAHGMGMPATVIARLAPLFHTDGGTAKLAQAEFRRVLAQIRFYLRSSPDTDGTTLYRLFHQGLADHLRAEAADLSALLDRLLISAPPGGDGHHRWDAAEPYVRRHGTQHAVDAGRLDLLIHLDPRVLEPLFNTATTSQGRLAAAVYRGSLEQYGPADPAGRRDLLAIDAARHGAPELAKRLASMPGLPARRWWPCWSTGSQVATPHLAMMTGHTSPVQAVACATLDGCPVAVTGGRDDGTVRVWDLARGRPRGGPLAGHTGPVQAVACATLDGRPVAVTGGRDGTVRVWDLASGRPRGGPLIGHTGPVHAVACTTLDGCPVAVTGGHDGTVRVWDLASGQPRGGPLPGHTGPVFTVACTTLDGRPVAVTGGRDCTVRVWDLTSGQPSEKLAGHISGVFTVACTTLEGHPVAVTGGRDCTVRVWDLTSDKPCGTTLSGWTSEVHAVACTTLDGRPVAVTGTGDGTVRVWDLARGQPRSGLLLGHTRTVKAVACTTLQGRPVAVTGAEDSTVRVWDLTSGQPSFEKLTGHIGWVKAVACTTLQGRPVAVTAAGSGVTGEIRVWDLASGQLRGPLAGRTQAYAVACTTLDGRPVAVTAMSGPVGINGTLRLWDLTSGEPCSGLLTGHPALVTALACTTLDGRPVAVTGGRDGTVRVLDLTSRRVLGPTSGQPCRPPGRAGWVEAVACTMLQGRPVAVTGGQDGTVRVWDLTSAQPRGGPLTGHTYTVQAVACTTLDGRPVAVTGGRDATVRMWDLDSHRQITFMRLPDAAHALAATPKGDLVVGFGSEVCLLRRYQEEMTS